MGDRIELEWRAPMRNTDGTTEKLELAEVEIRRRVIDLDTLVEEQTKTIEPDEPEPDEPEPDEEATEPGEPGEPSEDDPDREAASEQGPPASETSPAEGQATTQAPTAEPDEVEPAAPPATETPDPDSAETLALDESTEPVPAAPAIPVLVIPDFAPGSRYVTTLDSTEPGEIVTFEEEVDPTWIGKRVEYAVVYTNRSNRRGPRTTAVQIDPVAALAAPSQPTAEAGDGFVAIRWSLPEPESYFSVFRRRGNAPDYPSTPINPVPIAGSELEDRWVEFHVASCYTVRTVPEPPPPPPEPEVGSEPIEGEPDTEPAPEPAPEPVPADAVPDADPLEPTVIVPEIPPLSKPVRIESAPSPEICLTPIDTFAPPPPTGLVAVRSGEDVLLTWSDVERDDVSGYRVYRARDSGGPFAPLTEGVIRVPSYTDTSVESGQYFYAVTAVDDAPAANESERSALSTVTFTP